METPARSLATALQTWLAHHPELQARISSMPLPASSPLYKKYPALTVLPVEQVAAVICPLCRGDGLQYVGREGTPAACPTCAGQGLCCPACRGRRWLRAPRPPLGPGGIARCPACRSPTAEAAAILAHLHAAG